MGCEVAGAYAPIVECKDDIMANTRQDRRLQDRGMNPHAKFSKAHPVAGRDLLTDAGRAQTLLDIAETARKPARAYGNIASACRALIQINQCLRTRELNMDVRAEIEEARNALRLRLARIDNRVTRLGG